MDDGQRREICSKPGGRVGGEYAGLYEAPVEL